MSEQTFEEVLRNFFPEGSQDFFDAVELLRESASKLQEAVAELAKQRALSGDFETNTLLNNTLRRLLAISKTLYMLDVIEPKINLREEEFETGEEEFCYLGECRKGVKPIRVESDWVRENVRSWKGLFTSVMSVLYGIKQEELRKLAMQGKIKGKKCNYLSSGKIGIRKPYKVAEGLYIETNLSSERIQKVLHRILVELNMSKKNLTVFIRKHS